MNNLMTLPDSELDVMLVLWQYTQPVRTATLLADISKTKSWSKSTVKALLSRLVQKGFVEETRDGRFTLYKALVAQQAYRAKETGSLLARFYQNSTKHMIASLVSDSCLTEQDLAEIAQLLVKAGEKDAD